MGNSVYTSFVSFRGKDQIVKEVQGTPALFGPSLRHGKLFGEANVFYADDVGELDYRLGCHPFSQYLNTRMAGKIIVLNRGGCSFSTKIRNVQEIGGIMAIILSDLDSQLFMDSQNGTIPITIPSILLSQLASSEIMLEMPTSISVSITYLALSTKTATSRLHFNNKRIYNIELAGVI